MTFDKRITLGNVLTIVSFFAIGLAFVFTTRSTAVEAAQSSEKNAGLISQNTDAIRTNTEAIDELQHASDNSSKDMEYLTIVVQAIADAVDAKIPIREPRN